MRSESLARRLRVGPQARSQPIVVSPCCVALGPRGHRPTLPGHTSACTSWRFREGKGRCGSRQQKTYAQCRRDDGTHMASHSPAVLGRSTLKVALGCWALARIHHQSTRPRTTPRLRSACSSVRNTASIPSFTESPAKPITCTTIVCLGDGCGPAPRATRIDRSDARARRSPRPMPPA